MKILAIDIGAGTQDILIYDSSIEIANAVKAVLPSQPNLLASEVEKFPLGVFYTKDKPTFLEKHDIYQKSKEPLFKRERDLKKFAEMFL